MERFKPGMRIRLTGETPLKGETGTITAIDNNWLLVCWDGHCMVDVDADTDEFEIIV